MGRGYSQNGRRRWEYNIRMDLEEIGINAGNWVDSAQECGIEPPGSISHGTSYTSSKHLRVDVSASLL